MAAAFAAAIVLAGFLLAGFLAMSRGPRDLVLQGTVETDPIHVGSRIGGRVRSVLAEEGAIVQPGQLLVQFEDEELVAAKAAAQSAIGRLNELQPAMELFLRAAQRRAIEAPYVAALAQYEAAQKAADRNPAGLATARHKLDQAARARERALKQSPSPFAAEDPAARIRLLDLQIAELAVRAPAQAVVETLAVRPGDLVPPGRPVAVLIEPARAYVMAYVTADSAVALRPGLAAKIRIARATTEYDAIVQHIASSPEYSPRMGTGELGEPDELNQGESRFAVKLRSALALDVRPGTRAQVTIPAPSNPK